MTADYEAQASQQTLAEGLAEYYARHPGLSDVAAMPPEAQAFFRSHDVAHVVFGCGIALPDEAVVKIASIFGTTAGFGVLRGYRLEDSRLIYTRLERDDVLTTVVASARLVPRTILRCARQRRKWPWEISEHDRWRDVPLATLRAEFGIRVAHA